MTAHPTGYWRKHAIRTAKGLTRKHGHFYKATQCRTCPKWHVIRTGRARTITVNTGSH